MIIVMNPRMVSLTKRHHQVSDAIVVHRESLEASVLYSVYLSVADLFPRLC